MYHISTSKQPANPNPNTLMHALPTCHTEHSSKPNKSCTKTTTSSIRRQTRQPITYPNKKNKYKPTTVPHLNVKRQFSTNIENAMSTHKRKPKAKHTSDTTCRKVHNLRASYFYLCHTIFEKDNNNTTYFQHSDPNNIQNIKTNHPTCQTNKTRQTTNLRSHLFSSISVLCNFEKISQNFRNFSPFHENSLCSTLRSEFANTLNFFQHP